MDTTNLRENSHKLISYLERENYSKEHVRQIRLEIKRILNLAGTGTVLSYEDVYRKYKQDGCSIQMLHLKRSLIGAIEQFDISGQYPNGEYKQNYLLRGARYHLCSEYKAIIDYYADSAKKSNKKGSTIRTESNAASFFLLKLQQSGIGHLSDVTEENVLTVLSRPDESRIKYSHSNIKGIKTVLKTCSQVYPSCEKMLTFMPDIRKKRKNIQYLTEEEIAKIKNVLSSQTSSLTLRDNAIGNLILYTGLRRCDIAGMKITTVDFNTDFLYIHQQKTSVPLTLPLTAIVGNAIYDYIETERPDTACEYLFISQHRPFGRISSSVINRVVIKIMDAAGIRLNDGDRRGAHIFRHRFATKLLANGVSRVIISGLVGHLSPNTLDDYLSADFPQLKECSLSVERFPVSQEVLAI